MSAPRSVALQLHLCGNAMAGLQICKRKGSDQTNQASLLWVWMQLWGVLVWRRGIFPRCNHLFAAPWTGMSPGRTELIRTPHVSL